MISNEIGRAIYDLNERSAPNGGHWYLNKGIELQFLDSIIQRVAQPLRKYLDTSESWSKNDFILLHHYQNGLNTCIKIVRGARLSNRPGRYVLIVTKSCSDDAYKALFSSPFNEFPLGSIEKIREELNKHKEWPRLDSETTSIVPLMPDKLENTWQVFLNLPEKLLTFSDPLSVRSWQELPSTQKKRALSQNQKLAPVARKVKPRETLNQPSKTKGHKKPKKKPKTTLILGLIFSVLFFVSVNFTSQGISPIKKSPTEQKSDELIALLKPKLVEFFEKELGDSKTSKTSGLLEWISWTNKKTPAERKVDRLLIELQPTIKKFISTKLDHTARDKVKKKRTKTRKKSKDIKPHKSKERQLPKGELDTKSRRSRAKSQDHNNRDHDSREPRSKQKISDQQGSSISVGGDQFVQPEAREYNAKD